LGSNLTIGIRSIWSDSTLTDNEKVEAIRVVNEVSHQVFNWMNRLKKKKEAFYDQHCFSDISNLAKQNKRAAGEISQALRSCYQYDSRQNQ
jgi:hypothetical protein